MSLPATTTTMTTYTIRSTSCDISKIVPTNLMLAEAQRWARNQAKADAMSYGLTIGLNVRIEAEYDGDGEAVAYRIVKLANRVGSGWRSEQEIGRVEIVEVGAAPPVPITPTTAIPRSIKYDRATRDYLATVDQNPIGYFPSYLKAEEACDDHIADLLERGLIGEPDAGSFCPGCGDALVGDGPFCAACTEAGEAEIASALAEPADPETLAAVDRARERVLAELDANLTCLQITGIALDIKHPRELFYRLWHDEGYATKAPPGATCTVEVCAACQCLLLHHPFSKPDSYRLFAYCEKCDMATEV